MVVVVITVFTIMVDVVKTDVVIVAAITVVVVMWDPDVKRPCYLIKIFVDYNNFFIQVNQVIQSTLYGFHLFNNNIR
jgi:hypothetical protein